ADLFAFTFADFLHENLRSAEAKQKSVTREVLHDSRFHGYLHGMARVRRNDAPAELNAPRLSGDHGQYRGRRTRFKTVFAPPRIRFRNPKSAEARFFTSLGHGHGLVYRLHAELQYADVEGHRHDLSSVS